MHNKFKFIIIFILGLLFGGILVFLCTSQYSSSYTPYFKIVGDVENVVAVRDEAEYKNEMMKVSYKDKTFSGIPLIKLLEKAGPLSENSKVLFVGTDGLTSEIELSSIKENYIYFSDVNGWNVINLEHPISSNIKHILEIIVASKETENDFGVQIFNNNKNIKNITCGQIKRDSFLLKKRFEGTSEVTINGNTNEVTVYTSEKLILLEDMIGDSKEACCIVFGKDGSQTRVLGPGALRINDNTIDYLFVESGEEKPIEDIVGVYYGDNIASNTDIYFDTEYYLNKDEKIMVILLDGFSFEQWEYCANNGHIPCLESSSEVKKVLSAYKPVTNTGMATMITGQTPNVHGVHDRSVRKMNCDTIFKLALDKNKKACLIEADKKILNTEIQPILNIDTNKNGQIDDEVLDSALTNMKSKDLCFIHFHGIDDLGHTYGPFSQETLDYITEIDDYVSRLMSEWDGVTVITADHGMHTTQTGGTHGSCRFEDMVIPYMTINHE